MEAALISLNVFFLALFFFLVKRFVQRKPGDRKLPPGPSGYPIIGNLLDWPSSKEWETYTKWAEIYGEHKIIPCLHDRISDLCTLGDIVHVNLMGQHIILLNSIEATTALFHQKANLYCDRPHLTFAGELVGWKDFITVTNEATSLKEQRRLLFQEMGTKVAVDHFTSHMEARSREFICFVLDDPRPEALLQHIRT
jgi:hypothetical protein